MEDTEAAERRQREGDTRTERQTTGCTSISKATEHGERERMFENRSYNKQRKNHDLENAHRQGRRAVYTQTDQRDQGARKGRLEDDTSPRHYTL